MLHARYGSSFPLAEINKAYAARCVAVADDLGAVLEILHARGGLMRRSGSSVVPALSRDP